MKASSGSIITFAVVCRVGEHHNRLPHECSPCEKFAHTYGVKLKHNGDTGMGHLWLMMVGHFSLNWGGGGHLLLEG